MEHTSGDGSHLFLSEKTACFLVKLAPLLLNWSLFNNDIFRQLWRLECEIGLYWNDPIIAPGCCVIKSNCFNSLKMCHVNLFLSVSFLFSCCCWLVWYGMACDQDKKEENLWSKSKENWQQRDIQELFHWPWTPSALTHLLIDSSSHFTSVKRCNRKRILSFLLFEQAFTKNFCKRIIIVIF